jgi:recombination protein RecT
MSTQIQNAPEQKTAKSLFQQENVKQKFNELLGKKSQGFITSVLQCAAQNSLLAKADPNSILQAAMVAATLDLPINNNLGFAYIIPYKTKIKGTNGQADTWKDVAQFQMGYKGFIQLSQRSGQFKTISVTPIYQGQLIRQNPLTGFEFDFDSPVSVDAGVIGYAAFFQLLNGFEKTLYMTVDSVMKHGGRYSKTFNDANGLWKKDFDGMASKTVLKLLLSKFAPLSIEMQSAVITDQSVINNAETQDISYIDNTDDLPMDKETERLALLINDATTLKDLQAVKPHLKDELIDLFNQRTLELGGK